MYSRSSDAAIARDEDSGAAREGSSSVLATKNVIIGHGSENDLGKAYSGLGLLRLHLGFRSFGTSPGRNRRRNEVELFGEVGQGL